MRIRSAVGLVLVIITLKFLMSDVFSGLEITLVQFFEVMQSGLGQMANVIENGIEFDTLPSR